jgi:hypothetical protein
VWVRVPLCVMPRREAFKGKRGEEIEWSVREGVGQAGGGPSGAELRALQHHQ